MMGTAEVEARSEIDAAAEEALKNLTLEENHVINVEDEFDYDENEIQYKVKENNEKLNNTHFAAVASQNGDKKKQEEKYKRSSDVAANVDGDKATDDTVADIDSVKVDKGFENVSSTSSDIVAESSQVKPSDDYMKAETEWNNVQEITISTEPSIQITNSTEPITFRQAVEYFQTCNLSEYHEKIRPCIQYSGLSSLWHIVSGPARLSKNLTHERDFIFVLALMPFDNSEQTHVRVLYTLYKKLTKSKIDCPRFGPHWENIGFQGNDPSTDLRGCGMLGLLTTLYFTASKDTAKLAASVYRLSQDEIQNFPFSVMSINVTRISLQILREGKLNKTCNTRMKERHAKYQKDDNLVVFHVFLELYLSIFYHIYHIWKTQNKTMVESGFVLKEVEDSAKKKPLVMMKNFIKLTSKDETKENIDKIQSFVGVEDLDET